ncbi:MAG: alpha/beta fold hydrolase [Anaerolineales bacterium]|jgi:proline iminopeptidase
MKIESSNRYVNIGDTRLFIVERGEGHPIILLHGGPGLDHHEFADYLDPLCDQFRLILVDMRAQGKSDKCPEETWTLEQMAKDVVSLASAIELDKYAVLGHSYGAFVALQNAVDFPGAAAQTIVSGGVPSSRFLEVVDKNLAEFEPESLRKQVADSWAREADAKTQEDFASLMHAQMSFHFGDPLDPRIADYEERTAETVYSPAMLRHFAIAKYGGIEVENRLKNVTQPVLVCTGRYDRACTIVASEAMAQGLPNAELVIFEKSGHMTFVEENERYLEVVRGFLNE